jgi:class 3 adenylate cyclase
MADLPDATVTFLCTDVECSTELVKRLQEGYAAVLATHYELLGRECARRGGITLGTEGDALFIVFGRAREAVEAAVASQRALAAHTWPGGADVSVRMGLHTGEPYRNDDEYTGVAVHRAARMCTIAHGGQVLLSGSTAAIIDDHAVDGIALRDLGEHRLKDIARPERVFQVVADGLPSDFPPPRSIEQQLPLTGTVTTVVVEGRRVMRLSRELPPEDFGALLDQFKRVLSDVFQQAGGRYVETSFDTALAAFATAKQAAHAAIAAQRAVATPAWPDGLRPAISVGLHSGSAGVGWVGPAAMRCSQLCDAAEGGQILLSPATASLLEDEDLAPLSVKPLGSLTTRRTGESVRAYTIVVP